MTEKSATTTAPDGARQSEVSAVTRFIRATEVDTRMLGMLGALLSIWIVFHFFSDGKFLTPRNLWNLSVQTSSVAIMATGMVLIIVTRHIDLSVGSILGFVAMVMGVMQTITLPALLGLESPYIWVITLVTGIVIGGIIGGLHGYVIAYLSVPAFIVTLGGFWCGEVPRGGSPPDKRLPLWTPLSGSWAVALMAP